MIVGMLHQFRGHERLAREGSGYLKRHAVRLRPSSFDGGFYRLKDISQAGPKGRLRTGLREDLSEKGLGRVLSGDE